MSDDDFPPIDQPENDREARPILRALMHPLYKIPKGAGDWLPIYVQELIATKKPNGEYKFKERTRHMAIKTLMSMIGANFEQMLAGIPQLHLHGHLHQNNDGPITIEAVRNEILSNPEYVEYLRSCAENGDPSDVREIREPGEVVSGDPSRDDRPGDCERVDGQGTEANSDNDATPPRQE